MTQLLIRTNKQNHSHFSQSRLDSCEVSVLRKQAFRSIEWGQVLSKNDVFLKTGTGSYASQFKLINKSIFTMTKAQLFPL